MGGMMPQATSLSQILTRLRNDTIINRAMDTLVERWKGSFRPPARSNALLWSSRFLGKLMMTSASNVALVSMSENSFYQNKSNLRLIAVQQRRK